ncbi:D-aminoacyl-tRNA deacylase [Roseateles sp. MS654]|uniref:D-aminoacyl-tRNA deacylase n=1 Tax=Roseateles sp. MS654 TaxID=3412685 RepID=UPI003C2F61DC
MIALLQRVKEARVDVGDRCTGQIGQGLLLLLCAEPQDNEAVAEKLLQKILKLRIFSDEAGKMNRSVQDVGGGLLIVSQFTLAADTSGGNRPSFTGAAPAELGRRLYEHAVRFACSQHPVVHTGEFGADMRVSLVNDGPVTIPMRM